MDDKTQQHADAEGSKKEARRKKQTSSFKYVNLERERPQLTREITTPSATKKEKKAAQRKRRAQEQEPKATLKVIPLGGLDAIGKNMTVFECGNDLIVDDAGLMFPDDNHPGIDLLLPDYTYVLEHADKLRGIFITHGHEDHTGSLPYLLKDLDREVAVYGTKLTLGLIQGKLSEHRVKNAKLIEVEPRTQIKAGCFTVEAFRVNHSIPDAVGYFIQSPAGNVLHTGDFKLDQTPIDGVMTDFEAMAHFGNIGVDLMMSDSTNALVPTFTPSEREVGVVLNQLISQAKGKVIIATFASHIHRMQQICDAAVANGRKVVVTGRSMVQNTDIARKLGYLTVNDNDLIDAYYMSNLPPEKIVVMCTGSQGEPLSALARMSFGSHKTMEIDESDTVIVSATPVPGNEKAVTRVINSIAKIGATVYDKNKARVHVSGHAGSQELKIVLSIVRPRAFMPVHGETLHLNAHAKLAEDVGVPKDCIFICENGDTLELDIDGVRRGEAVDTGTIYVDGLSVGDTSQDVLDERTLMSSQGTVFCSFAVSRKRSRLEGEPVVEMHGITGGNDVYMVQDAKDDVAAAIMKAVASTHDATELRKIARAALKSYLWSRTNQRPLIIVGVIMVD